MGGDSLIPSLLLQQICRTLFPGRQGPEYFLVDNMVSPLFGHPDSGKMTLGILRSLPSLEKEDRESSHSHTSSHNLILTHSLSATLSLSRSHNTHFQHASNTHTMHIIAILFSFPQSHNSRMITIPFTPPPPILAHSHTKLNHSHTYLHTHTLISHTHTLNSITWKLTHSHTHTLSSHIYTLKSHTQTLISHPKSIHTKPTH